MADEFTIGGFSNQSMDIDADGAYLFVAVLNNSGFPQILSFDADLGSDGDIEYDPGDGTFIGVLCGKQSAGVVWAAGDFGASDKVVQYSDFRGEYWTNADPNFDYWTGVARPMLLGPSNDYKLTVGMTQDMILAETYFTQDTGPYWTLLNDDVDFFISAMDSLDLSPLQLLIAADDGEPYWVASYWYPFVEFSPNGGLSFEDVSGAIATEEMKVTCLVFG